MSGIAPSQSDQDFSSARESISEAVRTAFIQKQANDLTGLRPIVARSWFRSRAAGVDAFVDRGQFGQGRVDDQTMQALEPHLRRLDEVVEDMGGYVSLTAPNGVLIKPDFLRSGDDFPAGYSLLEESCGSNGEGLALEEGRGVWLAPDEHFREDMRGNWCFATLVRDPFHNRVRAVIGLTFPQDSVRGMDPATTLLMLEGVASRVEREIESRTSVKERAILREYLATSRRNGSAFVIAMDGKNTLMNSATSELLVGTDFSAIAGYARTVMATGEEVKTEIALGSVGMSAVEISPIRLSGSSVGAMCIIRARNRSLQSTTGAGSRPAPLENPATRFPRLTRHLDGTSPAFWRTLELAGRAFDQQRSISVVGEAGSGKKRVADALAAILNWTSVSVDAALQASPGEFIGEVLQRVELEQPNALIIENAHLLQLVQAEELVRSLAGQTEVRVFITSTRVTESTLYIAESFDMLEVVVAPLRSRREDIPILARAIALEVGNADLSDRLIAKLMNSDWPGNVDQLRLIIESATAGASGAEASHANIPHSFNRVMTSGRFSRLEEAELSEILSALKETKGNRRQAADMLQIGRSTLYRRIDYFRSRGIDF